nr:hypothetical protein GCM10020092_008920 [Actinoplanes digitatis]
MVLVPVVVVVVAAFAGESARIPLPATTTPVSAIPMVPRLAPPRRSPLSVKHSLSDIQVRGGRVPAREADGCVPVAVRRGGGWAAPGRDTERVFGRFDPADRP